MPPDRVTNDFEPLDAIISKFLKGMIILGALQKGGLLGILEMFGDCQFMNPSGSDSAPRIVPEDIKEFFLEHEVVPVLSALSIFWGIIGQEPAMNEPYVHGEHGVLGSEI